MSKPICTMVVFAVLGASSVAAAEGSVANVSIRDYQLYMDWKDGREDPRLEKLDEPGKLKKIARSLGVSAKELEKIITKVEPLQPTLAASMERAIQTAAGTTPLKGRIDEIHVDAGQGHVVAGVKWRCGDQRDWDKEASYAAWSVGEGGSVVKTLVVWCVNETDTKLFSAKISRGGFERIRKPTIDRFATSRYIKLFEDVRRGPHQ